MVSLTNITDRRPVTLQAMTTDTPHPAVQVVATVLRDTGELSGAAVDDTARWACEALAHAGWLHTPELQRAAQAVVDEYDNYIYADGRPPDWSLFEMDALRAALTPEETPA